MRPRRPRPRPNRDVLTPLSSGRVSCYRRAGTRAEVDRGEATLESIGIVNTTEPRIVEQRVLAHVGAFVSELGSTPVRGRVVLDDVLDRDLGVGSLERVELLTRLEEGFGVRFPDPVLAEAESVRDLVAAVLAGGAPSAGAAEAAVVPRAAGVPAPDSAGTLIEVLRWHAETNPDRVHVVLRLDDEGEQSITYGEL